MGNSNWLDMQARKKLREQGRHIEHVFFDSRPRSPLKIGRDSLDLNNLSENGAG
jgi:hypothetical protein